MTNFTAAMEKIRIEFNTRFKARFFDPETSHEAAAAAKSLARRHHWIITSAKVYIKPSATGKPIADMLVAEIIEAFEHGWTVIDDTQASSMLIRKSER